jgi:hypothetical protein
MSQVDLEALLTWLNPARKSLLAQLPKPTYERLIHRWTVPGIDSSALRRDKFYRPYRPRSAARCAR